MSTETYATCIDNVYADGKMVPAVVTEYGELGWSDMWSTLMVFAEKYPGVMQHVESIGYLITRPAVFLMHVQTNPIFWEDHGSGWDEFLKDLREHRGGAWWLGAR